MGKRESDSMQHHARSAKPKQFLQTAILPLAISVVARKRKSQMSKMDANLVGSPGVQDGFDKGR